MTEKRMRVCNNCNGKHTLSHIIGEMLLVRKVLAFDVFLLDENPLWECAKYIFWVLS
jgi:hypothetical protein